MIFKLKRLWQGKGFFQLKTFEKYIRNALSSSDLRSYAQIALNASVYSYYAIPCLYSVIIKHPDSLVIFCHSSNIAIKKEVWNLRMILSSLV